MAFSRQEQLDNVSASRNQHAESGKLLSTAKRVRSVQSSHLNGLYDEVDKLTKGKALLPTSDQTVDLANRLIADTKELVYGDPYLDRLKSFVPAGDNPSYPDVLISLRLLKQALDRFETLLQTEQATHASVGDQLDTIFAALEVARKDEEKFCAAEGEVDTGGSDDVQHDDAEENTDQDDEDEDDNSDEYGESDEDDEEEHIEYVRESEILASLNGRTPSKRWLQRDRDESIFNFAKLDTVALPQYLPPSDGITYVHPPHG